MVRGDAQRFIASAFSNDKMTRYRTVFIDLDDTLYDFSAASRASFNETYDLLGYNRFFDSFEHYVSLYKPRNLELWGLYGDGKITKQELNRIRFSYPLEAVGVHDSELAARFCAEALRRIPTKDCLIPGAVELLEYLHPKYKLYILSNGFKELQSHKMRTTGILHFFSDLVLSDDIGVNKPHPQLFMHALERAGATAEESIMIGDMFETDIKGAANVGIDQIFYNHQSAGQLPFAPTFVVNVLDEIKDIL